MSRHTTSSHYCLLLLLTTGAYIRAGPDDPDGPDGDEPADHEFFTNTLVSSAPLLTTAEYFLLLRASAYYANT